MSALEVLTGVGLGLLTGASLIAVALTATVLMYRWDGVDLWKAFRKGIRGKDEQEGRVRRGRFAFRRWVAPRQPAEGDEPPDVGEEDAAAQGGARHRRVG